MQNSLTGGSVFSSLIRFSVPFLISSFLQTFYGLADLFITGRFNHAEVITAVSIGSQLMHVLTVIIVGLAMGSTVLIGRAVGAGKKEDISASIGNTVVLFGIFAAALTLFLLILRNPLLHLLAVPEPSFYEAERYALICFAGIPFITAYNVISSIFRGLGDTKTPMYFVAVAGVINIILDYILIGPMGLAAAGAAAATVLAQAVSVLLSLIALKKLDLGVHLSSSDLRPSLQVLSGLLKIGVPVACQDGFIQVSFLVITAIGNMRGVYAAAGIGIVEKIISFLFLVPSAMLSSVAAIAAQNAGAGRHDRSREVLRYAITICIAFGLFCTVVMNLMPEFFVSLFAAGEPEVIKLGGQYLRTYVTDCIFAGIHFSFSGYFSAYGRSYFSFIHNVISVLTVRIPGAYLAFLLFPATLLPMGLAASMGSLLSAIICFGIYLRFFRTMDNTSAGI